MPLFTETEKDQALQILNLKHNLEMLGKALDEKDKRLKILYLRCWLLTNHIACDICPLKDACKISLNEEPLPGCDRVYETIKHKKE